MTADWTPPAEAVEAAIAARTADFTRQAGLRATFDEYEGMVAALTAARGPLVADAVATERDRLMGIRVPLLGRAGFSVSLAEFEQAYLGYGHSQSAERVCERGGFAFEELTKQLGHEPVSVRPIPGDRYAYRTQRDIAARIARGDDR